MVKRRGAGSDFLFLAALIGGGLAQRAPMRVPDLRLLVQDPDFRDLHAAAAGWMDRYFGLIGQQLPWLSYANRTVADFCATQKRLRPGNGLAVIRHGLRMPAVDCWRYVTVRYGCGHDLPARLPALRSALIRAGWSFLDGAAWHGQMSGERVPDRWDPPPGLGPPPVLRAKPEDHQQPLLFASVRWMDRALAATANPPEGSPASISAPPATALYQPVEFSGPDPDDIPAWAGPILAGHGYAVAVRMALCYYSNTRTSAQPHRLRRRLLPA